MNNPHELTIQPKNTAAQATQKWSPGDVGLMRPFIYKRLQPKGDTSILARALIATDFTPVNTNQVESTKYPTILGGFNAVVCYRD